MKKLFVLASIIAAFFQSPVFAQCSTPNRLPEFDPAELVPPALCQIPGPGGTNIDLSNLPQAASFTNVSLDISIGTVIHSATSVENVISIRKMLGSAGTFFVGAEIENSTASTVVDSFGGFFGVRKAFDAAEIYAQVGARRTWITSADGKPQWQIFGGVGAAWRPIQNGVLSKLACYGEINLVGRLGVVGQQDDRPALENRVGFRYLF